MQIGKLLLQSGAEVNIQDNTTGATPLHRAASKYVLKYLKLNYFFEIFNGCSMDIFIFLV